MDLRVINKRIIFQRMIKKRSKTLLSFFIQQQNWTGIQDANLTSVEFLIHRELPHYQLLCWVKWSSHLIRTCKLSYVPVWLYKVMICRVLISSNVRELGFVKSHLHCSSCKVSSYFSSSSCGTSRAATQGLVSGFRATYIAS